MFRQSASRIPLRAAALVLAVLALVLGAVLVAHAALITINTDDGQVDPQWQLAAPPITDPAGDNTQSPQNPNNDIIAGWAASGPEGVSPPTTYYFLMQVAGTTAIQDGYLAVAAVDCDGDGFMNNSSDRYVAYNPALDFVHTRDQASSDTSRRTAPSHRRRPGRAAMVSAWAATWSGAGTSRPTVSMPGQSSARA